MTTQEIYIVEPSTSEEAEALKAFAKALKMKITKQKNPTKERLEAIKYYQDHPEDEEVWIKRFPIYTVHAADIEPDDVYHLETFRDYYNLPQDFNKIVFFVE